MRAGRLRALSPTWLYLPSDDMLPWDACSYYKAFKDPNKPATCLRPELLLSEVNQPRHEDWVFSGGFPRGHASEMTSLLPASFSVLLSLSWALMLFSPNKAIRPMTYDRVARWGLQGVKVGAKQKCSGMDQWQRQWLEPFCLVGFLLFPSKGTKLVAPALDFAQHFTASLKFLCSGPSVGGNGRKRCEGGWAAVSWAKLLQYPAPVHLAPQSLPFLFSAKLLEGMNPAYISMVLSPGHIPVWFLCFLYSCSLVSRSFHMPTGQCNR